MSKKEFHKQFDSGTKTKLYIFNEYFKENFPVFLYSTLWNEILIYDFFAGKGFDESGEKSTSLNILEQIKPYCSDIASRGKNLFVILNDRDEVNDLRKNVNNYITECRKTCTQECIFSDKNLITLGKDFNEYFDEVYPRIFKRTNSAKLIFLDPFNFILDEVRFSKLINLKSTDFMCFMPSSYLRRFKELAAFKRYIDTEKLDYNNTLPSQCHRVIADYFESLIPQGKEYYIGAFSIKKEKNYYGLIFGSSHSLGAEKFQRVCWAIDQLTGEADYNIDLELGYKNSNGILFDELRTPQKIHNFNKNLKELIMSGKIETDKEAYKFALKKRCLVKHAEELLKNLVDNNQIEPIKTIHQDIHKHKPVNIRVL
jgi:three-Cys-motif partner protein